MTARIDGTVYGNPNLWTEEQWDEHATDVPVSALATDVPREAAMKPLFYATFGAVSIRLRRHNGDLDFRTSVYVGTKLTFQTVPCTDLRVALYIAGCVTRGYKRGLVQG